MPMYADALRDTTRAADTVPENTKQPKLHKPTFMKMSAAAPAGPFFFLLFRGPISGGMDVTVVSPHFPFFHFQNSRKEVLRFVYGSRRRLGLSARRARGCVPYHPHDKLLS